MRQKNKLGYDLRKISIKNSINIWVNEWIRVNILAKLLIAASKGETTLVLTFTPNQLEDLAKIDGNMESIKSFLYKEDIEMTKLHGVEDFDNITDNVHFRIQW